ncbi:hypothetical protein FVEN_g11868 [Fusarium venenatum]|uniref:GST N-terminal domain-containing protein n=2 Tax=Fusarium venenatum TaxID=56646 RepID=A0A2L2TAT4_9HYPO|nr:uncharacterized protein FVRRES_01585 [Fusarium venenatum]KAG8349907.1 hypothetical protein FVEN_g11868 [Fusarium venenatum]CEI65073.1 unnamed protein product [Fusarium venenatum]
MEGYVARDIEESYRMNAVHNGIVNATRATPGQFGILAPTTVPAPVVEAQQTAGNFSAQIRRDGNEVERSNGQLSTRIVVDPPNLEEWRDKLFNVDEAIILTHEEFETYFPHVDNVYSHRSTQRYKHKPFISHYWDCRMKGRPPGTPKSVDPNKKKRKRSARQLDLCDVKIKITEHFPSAYSELGDISLSGVDLAGQRFWTIQRVNGNGGNGKGDGVAGPHKHTLQRSDEIKKSSVQRHLTKQDGCVSKAKEKAKGQSDMRATGAALGTIRKHAKDNNFKLYAACFCPFSQRVWIALEAKGMSYQYCETNPFRNAEEPLLADSRACVPTIKHDDWTCSDSTAMLEYLEDMGQGVPLLPSDPRSKAKCRLWIGHINHHIVPNFHKLVQNQNLGFEHEAADRLQGSIDILVRAADKKGPFFLGQNLSLVDIYLAPFALRLSRVLVSTRGWYFPPAESRWAKWLDAIEGDRSVRATTSNHALYHETVGVLMRLDVMRHE